MTTRVLGDALSWPFRLIGFGCWYLWQIIVSNTQVIADIFTPRHHANPVIAKYQTRCRSEAETVLLSVLISLTPGTLVLSSMHDDAEGYLVFVHSMYSQSSQLQRELTRLESRMLAGVRLRRQR